MRCPRCGWQINTLSKDGVSTIRKSYPKSFLPWTPEDDAALRTMVRGGATLDSMVQRLKRQPSAIRRRIALYGWQEEIDLDSGRYSPQAKEGYVTSKAEPEPSPENPREPVAER